MAALPERVDAEAREVLVLVRDVEVARLLERFVALRRALADRFEDGFDVAVRERSASSSSGPSEPSRRRIGGTAHLQVDVAGAELERRA